MNELITKTFNLYCDESCHLQNDPMPYMLLSYIGVPYNKKNVLRDSIVAIKKEHHVREEIKWSNIFAPKEQFYNDLIDLFFATDLMFRAIVIKKEKIKQEHMGKSFDEFYYKMYYQLLYHKMSMENAYNIYLDIKDTLGAHKIKKLKRILQVEYTGIRNIQSIRSHESVFMQLTDFIMGAINYKINIPDEKKTGRVSKVKNRIISRIEKQSGLFLHKGTSPKTEKINLFFIELK